MKYLVFRKFFYVSKYFFSVLLILLVVVPSVTLSQEVQERETQQLQNSENFDATEDVSNEVASSSTEYTDQVDSEIDLSTENNSIETEGDEESVETILEEEELESIEEINNTENGDESNLNMDDIQESSTTTDNIIDNSTRVDDINNNGEVLGDSIKKTDDSNDDSIEKNKKDDEEDESLLEEFIEEIQEIVYDVPVTISRIFKKNIVVDKEATHSCKAEIFRIDISNKSNETALILLNKSLDISYEIEIGSLPIGVDVYFSKNGLYKYNVGSSDFSLELKIINKEDSQKGDFTIPIFYTQKGVSNSSVICQINIINQ